jgi:hypothetical protein
MKNHQFQTVLIAALSVGLGVALTSKDAIGYPAAAVASYGTNPVVSTGKRFTVDSMSAVSEAPNEQDLNDTYYAFDPNIADKTCVSIIRVPAGETLNLVGESRYADGCSDRGVGYSVAGLSGTALKV